jgi:subtilisin
MDNSIEAQLQARGVAQVIVVLKPPQSAELGKAMPNIAAAIPVRSSRRNPSLPIKLVGQIVKHFQSSEASQDSAMAAQMLHEHRTSAGATWFGKAAAAKDPTPPARVFPNLGVILGTVDRVGAAALRHHAGVADVVSPPPLRLIRPVKVQPIRKKVAARRKTGPTVTWGIRRLNADKLHRRNITGQGVIIGHLDTGVDGRHPALRDAVGEFAEFDSFGFQVSPNPNPHDTGQHGTHTAGTIAGRAVSGRSIGVAPGCKLASAIVIEGGNSIARVLAGMDWIIGRGARALAMSLGFPGYQHDFLPLTQLLRQRGVLPVFAVGNEGPGTSRSPGNYDEALSVGAMTMDDSVADFSSSQQFADWAVPDVVAPGVAVISAKPGGGYQEMDGSSMATPHIAGLAALLWQAVPSATVDQVEAAIFESCERLSGEPPSRSLLVRQGKGVPDALRALESLQKQVSPVQASPFPKKA